MVDDFRYFNLDVKDLAYALYRNVRELPIVSPHGHVDPQIFSSPDFHFKNPYSLLVENDHYVLRMLFSHGESYEMLLHQNDPREQWRIFAKNFFLFRGTPTGIWIRYELEEVLGINQELNAETSDDVYDLISEKLTRPSYQPRELYKEFNIELLATTDFAYDNLSHHKAINESGWPAMIIPTFRMDDIVHIGDEGWNSNIENLSDVSGIDIIDFKSFINAIQLQREYFISLGCTACDLSVEIPVSKRLSDQKNDYIFQQGLNKNVTDDESKAFLANMILEIAKMSCEDGLVFQLHTGVRRNFDNAIQKNFGQNVGFDFPLSVDFVDGLASLLNDFGKDTRYQMILFTLDESSYSRELAPLAGVYPSIFLGPPWWFHDSWNGMTRFFDRVVETSGIYNLAGFNDDTRSFLSIPARHDLWRRASVNWLASLVEKGFLKEWEANEMAIDLTYRLAKKAYRIES